jgi:hypothetical protein
MAPLLGIAAGTVAAFIVNTAASIAISYGVSLLAKKLAGEPRVQETQGGAQLEVRYGDDTPEIVALGRVCTAGVLRYDNVFDTANEKWQRVYELSSFYSTSLERVAINGDWVEITDNGSSKGFEVTSGDYAGRVWVKFLDGTQTAVDNYLENEANPSSRWTADHIGLGLTYVIVTLEYDAENLSSPLDFRFEIKGAPLYDWRLDDTAGGSGAHRWDDVSTWEWSKNPILMDYAYRRGGFAYAGDIFCGMSMSAAELPLAQYTAAANICDETVEGEPRYECHIILEATRSHRENLEDILQSCAGMNADGINVSYPIINASQTPVATLSRADLVDGEDYEFDRDGSFGDVVNSVNGTYSEPKHTYESTSYAEQTLAALVTLDRRTLDAELSFPMVTSKRQAQQLARIYLAETRYAATKSCVVHPKWQKLDVGDWITWQADEDGVDRDYQILAISVADLDARVPRAVSLQLQERDADIYTSTGASVAPDRPATPAAPVYLNEVENFAVIPYTVESVGSTTVYPALRASWDAIADATVDSVLVEWRPRDQASPPIFSQIVPAEQLVVILQEGIVASTVYEVRTQLLPLPARATVASAWVEVTSGALTIDISAELAALEADIQATIDALEASLDADIAANTAAITTEATTRASADTSQAALITAAQARADDATAAGLFKLEATTAPSGVTARFGVYLRASVAGAYEAEAAEYLEIKDGTTRKVILADQTVFADSGGTIYAMFEAGGAWLNNARIRNLTAANIAAGSITAAEIAAGTITAANLVAGTITANEIIAAGITTLHTQDWDGTANTSSTSYTDVGNSLTINVPAGALVFLFCSITGGASSTDAWQGRLQRDGNTISPARFMPPIVVGGTYRLNNTMLATVDAPSAGNRTYTLQHRSDGGGSVTTRSVYLYALVIRR